MCFRTSFLYPLTITFITLKAYLVLKTLSKKTDLVCESVDCFCTFAPFAPFESGKSGKKWTCDSSDECQGMRHTYCWQPRVVQREDVGYTSREAASSSLHELIASRKLLTMPSISNLLFQSILAMYAAARLPLSAMDHLQ